MRTAAVQEPPREKAGFTLVEVIISVTLMSVVFMSAFGAYFLGMRIIEDAREEVRASQIIQSEVERLRTKNWAQLNDMEVVETFEPQGTFVKQYAKEYSAIRYIIPLNADLMLVVVQVQWTNSNGLATRRWFNSIFTRDGLNDYYYRDI